MPCAELLQANSGSGVLSKLLMSLGSSKGVRSESKESLLPFQGMAFPGTGTQGHHGAVAPCTKLLCQPQFCSGSSTWIVPGSHQSYSSQDLAAKSDSCSQENLDEV